MEGPSIDARLSNDLGRATFGQSCDVAEAEHPIQDCLFSLREASLRRPAMILFAVACAQNRVGRAMWGLTTLSQLAFGEIEHRQALHGVSGWNDRPSAKDAAE